MIEPWVIDRLNPLPKEKLIILADPQRMIRPGAHAVDGWARENGFTVLLCTGNLGLRDMYENLRDDRSSRSPTSSRSRRSSTACTATSPAGRSPRFTPAPWPRITDSSPI